MNGNLLGVAARADVHGAESLFNEFLCRFTFASGIRKGV